MRFLTSIGFSMHVEAGDVGCARGGRKKAREDAHRGGFAGAVRTEKPDDLAFFDFERNIVDRDSTGVSLGETLDFNHMLCPRSEQMTDVILDVCGRLRRDAQQVFSVNFNDTEWGEGLSNQWQRGRFGTLRFWRQKLPTGRGAASRNPFFTAGLGRRLPSSSKGIGNWRRLVWGGLSGRGPAFLRVQPAGKPAAGRIARPTVAN